MKNTVEEREDPYGAVEKKNEAKRLGSRRNRLMKYPTFRFPYFYIRVSIKVTFGRAPKRAKSANVLVFFGEQFTYNSSSSLDLVMCLQILYISSCKKKSDTQIRISADCNFKTTEPFLNFRHALESYDSNSFISGVFCSKSDSGTNSETYS